MAKKKKNKEKKDDAPASGSTSSAAVTATSGAPIDVAFAAGNYAVVRRFAKTEMSEKAKALLDLVKIDKVQIAVGLGALAILILVAMLTLRP